MAASSSSPSSGGHCKYDVFLSFRGEDTRKNFVCHLYRALEQKAIHTFIDSEELQKGNKISELLNAVDESSISVVVLSQNYATSTWCLKELVKIMECKDKKQQIVVPVFYEVDPSHIRKLNKMFGEAFAKHEQNPNLDKEVLETWKTALKGIADLSGWDSRQYKDDIELIEKVVADILEKWIHIPGPSSLANNLVGMDHHVKEVSLRLCRGKNDVGVVGIWGMGGIGKTTIARAVYEKIIHQFEHKCFFSNVKERFAKKDEAQMRGELLSMILNGNVQSVDIFNEGSNAILGRLSKKKVLVVLDDVDTFSQIEALLGDFYSFGVGSRILVTTRDKESLAAAGVYEIYEPRCLNHNESLKLFMKHAFRTNQPSKEYSDLSDQAIEYAQGLPLALKVLGASLYDKSIDMWKELLEKIKTIPERKIMDVLRTSFEELGESEKDIFLDIACLFREWDRDLVTEILDSCGFSPRIGLRVLVDRALITLSSYGVDMHDLLQEMGREIVRLQSTKEPGKRSRLWNCEDVNRVLTQNTATDAVECLMLDLSNSKDDLSIDTGAVVRMTKLRLLIIYYSFYFIFDDAVDWECEEDICPVDGCKQLSRGDLESLSHELRFLLWHGCPLKSLPSTFIPKNLIRLDMRGSHIQKLWEGKKPLQNLKVIKLSHCRDLVNIPDFTEAINLQKLFLDGCSSLFEVHSSVFALQNLHFLDLKGCKQLKILPSCIHMSSLQTLNLNGCSNFEKFPEISGIMKELPELHLDGMAIKGLPSSIDRLLGIKNLSMRNCKSLEFLPDSICNLANLTHLNLSGCSVLHNLPEKLGDLESLHVLDIEYSGIKQLPFSILRLGKLRGDRLSCIGCKEMTAPLSAWQSSIEEYCSYSVLLRLDLSDCNMLELSDGIAHMSSLKTLKLCRNNLESLPVTMNQLRCLTHIELEACKRLKSVPELSSSIICIDAHDCTALETVSTPKSRNFDFRFSNCFRLVQANLFRDFVETHSLDQDNHQRSLCFNMCLPGSEVPEWFNLRDTGRSVTFHLPLNSLNNKLLGFAICIVINFSGARHDVSNISNMYGRCNWTSKGDHGEHFFQLDLLGRQYRTRRFLESDHLFMGYMSWSEYGWIAEDRLDAFKIGVETGTCFPTDDCFTSSCGVRLVYANHEEMENSVTQPIIHVDSQRMEDAVQQGEDFCAKGWVSGLGAPFFPNQLEIRESGTEWEAESSESGERRGKHQTLELLLEPQTDSKEEAGGDNGGGGARGGVSGVRVGMLLLVIVWMHLSLRKRETEREGDRVTRVSDDGEMSELGSHSGLVVPNSQIEGKEEKELIGDESLAGRGLLGPLCSCFYWLGEVWRGKREVAEAEDYGLHETKEKKLVEEVTVVIQGEGV